MDDLLPMLPNVCLFRKIDLRKEYHQIELTKKSRERSPLSQLMWEFFVINGYPLKELEVNKGKYVFKALKLKFLGHRLAVENIKPALDKVQAVRDCRIPETANELDSFLGLVNFVARFIPNLSTKAEVLCAMVHGKTSNLEWKKDQVHAFGEIEQLLSEESSLSY